MKDPTAYIKERVRVNQETGCWEWTNSVASHGYGNAFWKGKATTAHRLSYESFVGQIPEGHQIDHLCRNRKCVNPSHLEAVTQHLNIRRQHGGVENLNKCPVGHDREHSRRDRRGDLVCRLCKKERWKHVK